MASWTINLTESGNDEPITASITTTLSTLEKVEVGTYNSEDANIPDAVQDYLSNHEISATVVQILYLQTDPSGQGPTTFTITANESNMLSEDPKGNSNGVLVVFDQSAVAVNAHKKSRGKVKMGSEND